MLENLSVRNMAIIREMEVEFGNGLNILTGETGAGKSVILGSVNMALGAKASKTLLRSDAEYAETSLVFALTDPVIKKRLEDDGFDTEDDRVYLSRKISASKSICKLNGETLPASKLRQLSEGLIDIHGQQDSRFLLDAKNHLHLLDVYAGSEVTAAIKAYQDAYQDYKNKAKLLEDSAADQEERLRELSFLEFEIQEIENADLREGEDVQLEEAYGRMRHGLQIVEALSEAEQKSGYMGAGDALGEVCRALSSVTKYDSALEKVAEQAMEVEALLSDLNHDLAAMMDDYEFSEEEFHQTEERLNLINKLKQKYGKSLAAVFEALEEKKVRHSYLEDFEANRLAAEQNMHAAYEVMMQKGEELSTLRRTYAGRMETGMQKELKELHFLQSEFEICLTQTQPSASGLDQVSFLLSVNPGEAKRPLEKIASGGELSRIMLALKSLSADENETETLIFDEIDSGISGRTAQAVAEKLKRLSKDHQIICITHLPQIAAMADHHFLIEKSVQDAHTQSAIRKLDEEESVAELARMMGGVEITQAAIDNAREMKQMAVNKS